MLIKEILLEALNVELTAKNFGAKLAERTRKDRSFYAVSTYSNIFSRMDREILSSKAMDPTPEMLNETYSRLIEFIAEFDPTPQKKYLVRWIIPKYLSGGINYAEDFAGVHDDLMLFDRYKPIMPIKDIFQIKDASQLATIVKNAVYPEGSISTEKGTIPPHEVEQANKESIPVFENEKFKVIIPLSEHAAQFWGRRSSWCTAYGYKYGQYPDRTSWYRNYDNGEGQRLLIFFDKVNSNGKNDVQAFYGYSPSEAQIMNVEDRNVIGQRSLKQYFEMLPNEAVQLIVKQCLADYNIDESGKQTKKFKDVSEAVEELGNDTMKSVAKNVLGGDYNYHDYSANEMIHIIYNLPKETDKKITEYLKLKYESGKEVDEAVAEDYEDMSVAKFIEEYEEELKDLLQQADYRAQEQGAESEMYDDFAEALKSSGLIYTDYDSPCEFIISENIIDVLYNPTDPEDESKPLIELEQPYYGWNGYSKEVFTEDYELNHFLDTEIAKLKGNNAT